MRRFAIGLMVIGIALLFSVGVLALPQDGLVLHYAFDRGSPSKVIKWRIYPAWATMA